MKLEKNMLTIYFTQYSNPKKLTKKLVKKWYTALKTLNFWNVHAVITLATQLTPANLFTIIPIENWQFWDKSILPSSQEKGIIYTKEKKVLMLFVTLNISKKNKKSYKISLMITITLSKKFLILLEMKTQKPQKSLKKNPMVLKNNNYSLLASNQTKKFKKHLKKITSKELLQLLTPIIAMKKKLIRELL